MATQTIPAQNRAPGTYGPFGPFALGANNSIDIQFNSTDWSTPGGTFSLVCDRLPSGKADVPANWVIGDGGLTTSTGGTDRFGNPNVPHFAYDCNPGDSVRAGYTVAGRTINLGAVVTTSVK